MCNWIGKSKVGDPGQTGLVMRKCKLIVNIFYFFLVKKIRIIRDKLSKSFNTI